MRAILGGRCAGLALLCALGAVCSGIGPRMASAGSLCQGPIRVLLQRSPSFTTLEVDGRSYRFEAVEGGLRVNEGRRRTSWRGGAKGRSRVGDLRVRGALEVLRTEQGLSVVNEVPLEDYVAGVLQGEVPAGWSPAVLRAQAVVSRTYALHERGVHGARGYHLEASTMSQVYAGADVSPSIRSAVESTRCEVLVYDGAPILAAFHSASGGRTASAREVWGRDLRYLVSQDVADEDDSPDTYWRALVSRTTLGRALGAAGHEIGEPKAIEVTKRSPSGRVAAMRIRGSRGKATLSGRQLRSLLGEAILKSTLFELRPHPSGFRFVGSGHGHGVGMSQWGARSLAENGADYLEILRTFYPGAELQRGRTSRVDRDTWPEERRSRGSRMREERKVATRSGGEE